VVEVNVLLGQTNHLCLEMGSSSWLTSERSQGQGAGLEPEFLRAYAWHSYRTRARKLVPRQPGFSAEQVFSWARWKAHAR
jgi:hypothetical protein